MDLEASPEVQLDETGQLIFFAVETKTTTYNIFYQLENYPDITSRPKELIVYTDVTVPIPNTIPYFKNGGPGLQYTFETGSYQELLFDVFDDQANDFTIEVDIGDADFINSEIYS